MTDDKDEPVSPRTVIAMGMAVALGIAVHVLTGSALYGLVTVIAAGLLLRVHQA